MMKGSEASTRELRIGEDRINKATVAVAREMLAIIYHMLLKKEPYRGMKEKLADQKKV